MSQPQTDPTGQNRLTPLIEAMDRPLLALAVVAMALYVLELRGVSAGWGEQTTTGLTFLIDAVFLLDLVLKLVAYGQTYTHAPWFLIDLLSVLPILDTLTNGLLPIPPIRFFRGFRILRILRGLRVLRALRTVPAFEQFVREARVNQAHHRVHRLMNLGMLVLTGAMLVTVVMVRRSIENQYMKRIDDTLTQEVSLPLLKDLGGHLERPTAATVITREVTIAHQRRTVYFDLRPVDERVGEFEFFLSLGMMFALAIIMYIMMYHEMGVTQDQLRGLLNLALPQQVATQFLADPSAYAKKSQSPATVLFMDFVGFTRACETLAGELDCLAAHLEAATDRIVVELTRHDMIIDKYIGDAVMSFRGGPLVHGDPTEHARRSVHAALDSIVALAELNDPFFQKLKVGGASANDCLIGAFGTTTRLSYTILGDGVNLAARLEPACSQCGTSNLFDEATVLLCGGDPGITWRRWGRIRVEGMSSPVQVYEAFDAVRLANTAFIASFHLALEAFERHEIEHAHNLFTLADSQRPGGDQASRNYTRHCDVLIRDGRPVGWEPVFETHK